MEISFINKVGLCLKTNENSQNFLNVLCSTKHRMTMAVRGFTIRHHQMPCHLYSFISSCFLTILEDVIMNRKVWSTLCWNVSYIQDALLNKKSRLKMLFNMMVSSESLYFRTTCFASEPLACIWNLLVEVILLCPTNQRRCESFLIFI